MWPLSYGLYHMVRSVTCILFHLSFQGRMYYQFDGRCLETVFIEIQGTTLFLLSRFLYCQSFFFKTFLHVETLYIIFNNGFSDKLYIHCCNEIKALKGITEYRD